jgi:hypothetical protein
MFLSATGTLIVLGDEDAIQKVRKASLDTSTATLDLNCCLNDNAARSNSLVLIKAFDGVMIVDILSLPV